MTMSEEKPPRLFLVVVDDTPEMPIALHYASRRAAHTGGRVALLRVIPQDEVYSLASVAALMREEAYEEAEELLQRLAEAVVRDTGALPAFYIREGTPSEQLLDLINNDPTISTLVLAAGAGPEGPGPLVSYLVGKVAAKLRVPLTIVPGGLSLDQIQAVS
jgi:nucleotide-binding universal stress UspA family protein